MIGGRFYRRTATPSGWVLEGEADATHPSALTPEDVKAYKGNVSFFRSESRANG